MIGKLSIYVFNAITIPIFLMTYWKYKKMKANVIYSIIQKYLSDQESEAFAQWAFGKNHRCLSVIEKMERWNETHGEEKLLISKEKPEWDIPIMIVIWKIRANTV